MAKETIVGLFAKLSKEQQQAALNYKGPVNSGNCNLPCIKRWILL